MKKYFIGSFILLLLIGFSAFSPVDTQQKPEAATTAEWFELIENGNPLNANDYVPVMTQPCDGSSSDVCGVEAIEDPGNPGHPDLSTATQYVYKD